MPVTINSINYASGSVTPSALNTETTVYTVSGLPSTAIVEGYISLQNMQVGDIVTITVYITVDGTNYYPFLRWTTPGPLAVPIIRIHALQIFPGMGLKVTINQIAGTPRAYPYYFAAQVLSS